MNEYLKNLRKIEFVVTLSCAGRCKHCQNGDPADTSEHIDASAATDAIRKVCENYNIETVMTFGGESLLCPDVVFEIHKTAKESGVNHRQLITSGFFSKDDEKIKSVAYKLAESGVNDLLLSVDAFHQETIPLEPVMKFAGYAKKAGIPVVLNPAWLISATDGNFYNIKTEEIIRKFEALDITNVSGDVIFPAGNALKYLKEYFGDDTEESSPYEEDPEDVCTLSFLPNGDVLDGNIYKTDILDIIKTYQP